MEIRQIRGSEQISRGAQSLRGFAAASEPRRGGEAQAAGSCGASAALHTAHEKRVYFEESTTICCTEPATASTVSTKHSADSARRAHTARRLGE